MALPTAASLLRQLSQGSLVFLGHHLHELGCELVPLTQDVVRLLAARLTQDVVRLLAARVLAVAPQEALNAALEAGHKAVALDAQDAMGHWALGFDFTLMSISGLFGLTGIVINDSIILVSIFRELLSNGMSAARAAVEASVKRCRAIILTSVTTVLGLTPILFESSIQAQNFESEDALEGITAVREKRAPEFRGR